MLVRNYNKSHTVEEKKLREKKGTKLNSMRQLRTQTEKIHV